MERVVVLTVAESKRLIAKGVANLDLVKKALNKGMIAIARGTTNGYVAEEISGRKIDKTSYVLGVVLPEKKERPHYLRSGNMRDIVLRNGQPVALNVIDAVKEMSSGDVFIKGGNTLNYDNRVVGTLMGSPTGGTIGATLPTVRDKKINLVIPIGLEKSVHTDIYAISQRLSQGVTYGESQLRLMVITGIVVTEIEALEILAGVNVIQISSGGVGKAEGAVRLLLDGDSHQIEKALEIINEVQGEPPFIPS